MASFLYDPGYTNLSSFVTKCYALECFKMNVFNFLMLSDAAHGVAKNILDFNLCIK